MISGLAKDLKVKFQKFLLGALQLAIYLILAGNNVMPSNLIQSQFGDFIISVILKLFNHSSSSIASWILCGGDLNWSKLQATSLSFDKFGFSSSSSSSTSSSSSLSREYLEALFVSLLTICCRNAVGETITFLLSTYDRYSALLSDLSSFFFLRD